MNQIILAFITLLATATWAQQDSSAPLIDDPVLAESKSVTPSDTKTVTTPDFKTGTSPQDEGAATEKDVAPLDYESSEQISEDLSVSFPADI